MKLRKLMSDIADELVAIDGSGIPFRNFRPGVGPYGEPQLVRELARRLGSREEYAGNLVTKRTPDLLVRRNWAIEFKIVRPFGDNGKEAENWSVGPVLPSRHVIPRSGSEHRRTAFVKAARRWVKAAPLAMGA